MFFCSKSRHHQKRQSSNLHGKRVDDKVGYSEPVYQYFCRQAQPSPVFGICQYDQSQMPAQTNAKHGLCHSKVQFLANATHPNPIKKNGTVSAISCLRCIFADNLAT